MTWVKVNGISVQLHPGASVADYGGEVAVATAKMMQFRETWGDDEFFAIYRTPTFTCQRVNGEDQVIMGPVVEVEPVYEDEKLIRIVPESNYLPAFHTVDANGQWLGLTVCLTGRWGAPYLFLPVPQDKIWDFDYGQWHISASSVRPTDYEDQRWLGSVGGYEVFEVPAAHEYTAQDGIVDSNIEQVHEYTTDEWYEQGIPCDSDEGFVYSLRDRSIYLLGEVWQDILVYINWNLPETSQVSIESHHYRSTEEGTSRLAGYRTFVSAPGPPNACALAWAQVPFESNFDYWIDKLSVSYQSMPATDWYIEGQHRGSLPHMTASWSTFTGTDIEDGFFYCGITTYNTNFTDTGTRRPYNTAYENLPYYHTTRDVTEDPGNTGHDFVSVFGERIQLMGHTYEGNGYWNAPDAIRYARPRIYSIGDGAEKIALASVCREGRDYFDYHMFKGGFRQYDDPDARYVYVNDYRHELPLTVNDAPAFGNGEFSLVFIDDEEGVVTRDRGIYYDDPGRALTEG